MLPTSKAFMISISELCDDGKKNAEIEATQPAGT